MAITITKANCEKCLQKYYPGLIVVKRNL